MSLVALRTEVEPVCDLAEVRRALVHVDDGEEIVVLRVGVDTVDVEIFLGPIEALDEGGETGFRGPEARSHTNHNESSRISHESPPPGNGDLVVTLDHFQFAPGSISRQAAPHRQGKP